MGMGMEMGSGGLQLRCTVLVGVGSVWKCSYEGMVWGGAP